MVAKSIVMMTGMHNSAYSKTVGRGKNNNIAGYWQQDWQLLLHCK